MPNAKESWCAGKGRPFSSRAGKYGDWTGNGGEHPGVPRDLVVPDNYSPDKRQLLELYGAHVVLSDSRKGNNSHGELAIQILLEHPEFVMLNQQRNPANPQAHREATALEILRDFAGQPPDFFFAGIGTGGHITGVGGAEEPLAGYGHLWRAARAVRLARR